MKFLEQAFGAKLTYRHDGPDGSFGHSELRLGDSMISRRAKAR